MNDAFTAWFRLPGEQWQPVATVSTEDEAWRLLRHCVEQLRAKMIDTYVGPATFDPRGRCRSTTQERLFNGLME